MACPSDINVTFTHKCSSPEHCSPDITVTVDLIQLMIEVDAVQFSNLSSDMEIQDVVNEAVHNILWPK